MEDRTNEGDSPLFNLDDKSLINFANKTKNQFISDTVSPEMMRRMKIAIEEFNKNSSRQSDVMINLTKWVIGLTIAMGILALIQVILLIS